MPGRTPTWKAPVGAYIVDIFLPALMASAAEYCLRDLGYKSRCMKTGIELDKIYNIKQTAVDLLTIDDRGGFFNQEDLVEAMKPVHADVQFAAAVQRKCATRQMSSNEMLADDCYVIRAILSHIRLRRQDWKAAKAEKRRLARRRTQRGSW